MKNKKLQAALLVAAAVFSVGLSAIPAANTQAADVKNGGVPIDATSFPDAKFREYVESSKVDKDQDGSLSAEEAEQVTKLKLSDAPMYSNVSDLTGIEKFPNLQILYCNRTKITQLDLSENTKLEYLHCQGSQITKLDVSHNTELKELDCQETSISSLDISNNPQLKKVYCYSTNITDLNTEKNSELTHLSCWNTGIEELDLSNNTNLQQLYCADTKLKNLDLSANQQLTHLDCKNASLLWMNIGDNPKLLKSDVIAASADLEVPEGSFDLTEYVPGIDVTKVTIQSGAALSETIVSGYTEGTPIVYNYDCGTSKNGPVTLNVTVHVTVKEPSNVWTEELTMQDAVYGDILAPSAKAQKGTVKYLYSDEKDGTYTAEAPVNAGTYYVKAVVEAGIEDGTAYEGLESEAKQFVIKTADNEWTKSLSIAGWTEGESANVPEAAAKFGVVSFVYSDAENGSYTEIVPEKAGEWYVKAIVNGTANYTSLESDAVLFVIKENAGTGNLPNPGEDDNYPGDEDEADVSNDPEDDGITEEDSECEESPEDEDNGAVKTGDESQMGLWMVLFIASAVGSMALLVKKGLKGKKY